MIKTKSIYKPIDEKDGLRVLITRWYPRGIKREKYDIWIRDLAPSGGLLKKYKNSEIVWEDFKEALIIELNNKNSIKAINSLKSKNKSQNITLLCYEKEGDNCHRYIIKDLIEEKIK